MNGTPRARVGQPDHDGTEPDPRLTFANERTFLAWMRTALALIGGGLAAAEVVRLGPDGAQLLIAVPAIVLGAVIGIAGYRRWQLNQRDMRLGEPITFSPLPAILATGVTILGLVIAVLVVSSAPPK